MSSAQVDPAKVRKAAAFVEALVALELKFDALLFVSYQREHRVEIDGAHFIIGKRDGGDKRTIGIG